MPSKRDILALLPRNDLIEFVDAYGIEVPDKRKKDGLVEALASSRKAKLPEMLGALTVPQLRDLCEQLGLGTAKSRADLIDRLVGGQQQTPPGAEPAIETTPKKGRRRTNANGNGGNGNGQADDEDVTEGKLTTAKLERYLWSAADILRGSIDSSDYKSYIFGLLFLKRLSDRFDEECQALVAERIDPEDEDEHQFFVPTRARWSEIAKKATNIGEALNKACAALEEANSRSLEGVLLGIDFNDERRLGDAKARDTVLARLVQHFSVVDLRNANLAEPDMLGRAYEYLIERFADDAGKKGGEFYTPKKVVELIVEILAPKEGMRISDPTCGSGGMLIECAHYLERQGQNPRNLSLNGQEKNLGTWAICKMNVLLHGLPDARIEKGDTIRDPKLVQDGELMLFDRVIANPPFSLDEWGREVAEKDPHGRFRFGIPPKTKGDMAFVQHMVATLNMNGQLGVVMPHGVLFRGAAEGQIRQGLLEEDLVEAVVGLPPNLFYGTGIPAAVWVMNRSKPARRKRKVLFIEASREFKAGTTQNYLNDEAIQKISKTFHGFKDVERYARVVDLDEIERNDFNINISRYVDTTEAADAVNVQAAVDKLRELEARRGEAEAQMNRHLRELGYGSK